MLHPIGRSIATTTVRKRESEAMKSRSIIESEIRRLLLPTQPPENPLAGPRWAGLAFDRNRHEDLAPVAVWHSWMEVNCLLGCEELNAMRFVASSGADDVEFLSASLSALREWWERDANFLRDHYVCAADFSWIVRLDQDVTLFAADRHYMRSAVESIGGLDCAMEMMREDFEPGECDPLGLQLYLDGLLASLIA